MNKVSDTAQAPEAYEPPAFVALGSSHELTLAKVGSGIDNANKITV